MEDGGGGKAEKAANKGFGPSGEDHEESSPRGSSRQAPLASGMSTTGFKCGCGASLSLHKHKLQQQWRQWVEKRGPSASQKPGGAS